VTWPGANRRLAALVVTAAGLVAVALTSANSVAGARVSSQHLVISAAARHDISAPLRELKVAWPARGGFTHEQPAQQATKSATVDDPVLQSSATNPSRLSITRSFPGISDGEHGFSVALQGGLPPDTDGAVGRAQYVQMVNLALAIFSKQGAMVLGPLPANQVWKGFGGDCEKQDNGDPVVLYDHLADRWLLSQFAIDGGSSGKQSTECVAVSTSGDATGRYYRYAFDYTRYGAINDYPKLGIMPNAYYATYNFTSPSLSALVCALPRTAMLAGRPATQQCAFSAGNPSLMPADMDGRIAPPKNEPEYLLEKAPNALNLFRLTIDWARPAKSHLDGPTKINVAPYNDACLISAVPEEPNEIGCIPQPGSGPGGYASALESTGDRLMFRLAYRRFADGHEALVVNHAASGSFPQGPVSGVRWYELDRRRGSWAVAQQGTYAPNLDSRWEGSIAMDRQGDIALGYSVSGPATFPSIAMTGRLRGDPRGQLRAEQTVVAGMGSQVLPRWGDYSAMTIDPTDDCTFWYTTEFLKLPGTFDWSTAIIAARFPDCHNR